MLSIFAALGAAWVGGVTEGIADDEPATESRRRR